MKKRSKTLVLLFLLVSSIGYCQVRTNTSVGMNYSEGNSGILLGSLQSSIQFDSSKLYGNISPYFCYSQVKSGNIWTPKQRESYLSTSLQLRHRKINLYLFTDFENSLQKKYNFRGSIGLGIGRYYDTKNIHISTSLALMPEYYNSIYNQDERTLRLSLRFHLETKGNVVFKTTTLVQPSIFMDPFIGYENNFNLRSTNTILVPINKNLSIGGQVMISTCTLSEYTTTTIRATDITSSFILTYRR